MYRTLDRSSAKRTNAGSRAASTREPRGRNAAAGISLALFTTKHMLIELGRQFLEELAARTEGPLAFRFVFQPLMAVGFAIRDGLHDAKHARTPYLWTILSQPDQRGAHLREGVRATLRVIVLAAVLDLVYQLVVLRAIRPLETVVVAFGLAYLPYLLVRGPVARIARSVRRAG